MSDENLALSLLRKVSRDLNAARKTSSSETREQKIKSANEILRLFLNAAKRKKCL